MDTLTHALSGALLARAFAGGGGRRSAAAAGGATGLFGPPVPVWQAVVVGMTAAAFPDSDIVLKWVSDLAYLRGHRGVTHSVLMLPLWAALLGTLASLALRRREAWRRYSWLAAGSIAIHIAGDWITQFGTMLLAPLSDERFGLGSVFIIDLVLSGIIVTGLLGCALLPRSRLPAVAALALLPAWVGVSLVGKHEALQIARDYAKRHDIPVERIGAAPRPASPFNWTVFVFDGREYHVAHVNTRRNEPLVASADDNFIRRFSAPYAPAHLARWERLPKFGDDTTEAALAQQVWEHPEFAFFRWFAMFPLVYAVERGETTCVWYRDLRFAFPGRGSEPFRFGMCRADDGGWASFALDSVSGRAALP